MEIFLNTLELILVLATCCLSVFINVKILRLCKNIYELQVSICAVITDDEQKLHFTLKKIDEVEEKFDRHLLDLRDSLEPTKPMKSNNWDSIREAFRGPTRVDVNERN